MFGNHTQSHAKAKACSQCGATKTPQWREGPAGPKTLCNACGVKRVRQMRLGQEGQKQKAVDNKPPKQQHNPPQEKGVVLQQPVAEDGQDLLPARATRKRVKRVFDDGYVYGDDAFYDISLPANKRLHRTATLDSDLTDSGGEETTWAPMELNAAVDLLALSMPADMVAQAQATNVEDAAQPAEAKAQAALPPIALKEEMARQGWDLDEVSPDKVAQLVQAWETAETTRKEAMLACDAVSNVARIFALKQAASINAKSNALVAARQLKQMMAALDSKPTEVPTAGAVPRRPRTSGKQSTPRSSPLKRQRQQSEDVDMLMMLAEQSLLHV